MTTKTLSLTDMLAKSEKTAAMWEEKAREEREFLATLKPLLLILPADLPYTNVTQHVCYSDAGLRLEVEKLSDVVALLQSLPPVEAVVYKDSCTTFKPASHTEKEQPSPRGVRTPISPMWVELDNVSGPTAKSVWYTKAGDKLVQVEVNIKNVHEFASWSGQKRMSHGSVFMADRKLNYKLSAPHRISWYTGAEYHLKATLYWSPGASIDDIFLLSPSWKTMYGN